MVIAYGATLKQLLEEPRTSELGPGQPDRARQSDLERLIPESVRASGPIRNRDLGRACEAGLWLHFDFLEEAHQISQQIDTPEGSYWHGIMHRREGDFANASYWFRRAGNLPFFKELGQAAAQLVASNTDHPQLVRIARGENWDPQRFVDLCKACCTGGKLALEASCRNLQRLEWDHLFNYCYRGAIHSDGSNQES